MGQKRLMFEKKSRRCISIVIVLITQCIGLSEVYGQVPLQFNYQGRLTDSNGIPVVGISTGTFNIYKGGTVMGDGTNVFSETWTNLQTDANGVFSATVGSVSNMPLAALADGTTSNRYIEVVMNGQTNLPRVQIVAVPFAVVAQTVQGPDIFVNSTNGRVGVGGITDPQAALHVDGGIKADGLLDALNAPEPGIVWSGDHSGSGYVRIGDLQICWGSAISGAGSYVAVTMPQPFADTNYKVTATIAEAGGWGGYAMVAQNPVLENTVALQAVGLEAGGRKINWMAIGRWR